MALFSSFSGKKKSEQAPRLEDPQKERKAGVERFGLRPGSVFVTKGNPGRELVVYSISPDYYITACDAYRYFELGKCILVNRAITPRMILQKVRDEAPRDDVRLD